MTRVALFFASLAVAAGIGAAGVIAVSSTDTAAATCDPSYPDPCIPMSSADLDCEDIDERNFRVFPPDTHDLDTDDDGIGCEDPAGTAFPVRNLPKRAWAIFAACDSCAVVTPPTPSPSATSTSSATATPTASPTPTNTPTPTATVQTCGSATALITNLNKGGNPETVTISGNGLLAGWYVISENGNQRFDFPAGYVLSGTVTLASGPAAAANPPGTLVWTTQNIWNNASDDDAFLHDCNGTLRSTFEDGD
jgi:hypothetical protein